MKRLVLLLFFISLTGAAIAQDYEVISGKINGFKNGSKVFLTDDETDTPLDSTVLKNAAFVLKGNYKDAPRYLSLHFYDDGKNFSAVIFVQDTVNISGDKQDFPYNLKITGSSEQIRYNAYMDAFKPLNVEADSFKHAYQDAKDNSPEKNKAGLAYNAVGDKKQALTKKLILNRINSYYALNALYNYLPGLSKDTIAKIYDSLPQNLRQSMYGVRLRNYIRLNDTLKVNDSYYDFGGTDQHGVTRTISSLKKGYILIDFSTIHCGPCNESVEELRRIANTYKDKLTVVTFSVDNHKDWMQGVNDENPSWLSISDGKGNYSEPIIKYGVQAYPAFYLVSPEGKIVSGGRGDIEKHLVNQIGQP
jgi:thiol-disulfide isomerase/thioredoxin